MGIAVFNGPQAGLCPQGQAQGFQPQPAQSPARGFPFGQAHSRKFPQTAEQAGRRPLADQVFSLLADDSRRHLIVGHGFSPPAVR